VALAVVIFAGKLWRYGEPLGQATGMVLVAPGHIAASLHPLHPA
jgi:hypothetical protein